MKKNTLFASWAAAACLSLGCLALSGCTTTQAQADADDVVTAGALPAAKTCTKGDASSCPATCTKGDKTECTKDKSSCTKGKSTDGDV